MENLLQVQTLAAILDTPLVQALTPGILAGALLMVFLPWISTKARSVRILLAFATIALMARYLWWRYAFTLPPPSEPLNWVAGWVFIGIESLALLSSAVAMMFLTGVRDRSAEADAHAGWMTAGGGRPPPIDVLICTYNEEERIIERTIIGATGIDYPNYRTWVLDDGNRPWLKTLCEKLGCGYITRPDNAHAKAGNINHALGKLAALAEPPQFIAVLDADFVPTAGFLSRAMTLFHDPTVGIVQTPQHYINPDPIQTNLGLAGIWPDEQRFFFDIVMPAKDAWSCAFCCGTSSIIRFDALQKLGGVPTDSVTEDYLLTLRLKEIGYSTAYLNEPLTFGLAPEGLKEYVTQRGRWCLGFMQIIRGPSGPFSLRRRISFIDRLSLVEATLNWSFVYLYKFVGIIVPILYLLFDVKAVQVSLFAMLSVFLPYYVVHSLSMSWISRGRVVPVMSDISQLLTGPAALKAVVAGLLRPQGQKFHVTAKGGDRRTHFVEWPLLRIFLSLLVLALSAVLVGFTLADSYRPIGESMLALVWSWYNIVALALLCLICLEQPRRRRAGRFPTDAIAAIFAEGRRREYRMRDISVGGARFEGTAPGRPGTSLLIRIDNATLRGTIVRVTDGGFAVRFANSMKARIALVRHIYSAIHERAIRRVRSTPIARAIFRRLMG